MSSSTILIKAPGQGGRGDFMTDPVEYKKYSKILGTTLWIISSVFSAAKIDYNSNLTGISIAFSIQDAILIVFTAWMLYKGVGSRTVPLVIPWLTATAYSLYYNHYKSLSRMMKILKHYKKATILPWIALVVTSIGLVLRVILVLRILQLSANLWYRKKLEKELYESSN